MKENPGILHDIHTIRDIEKSLEEAESFVERVKSNKVKLSLDGGNISITREEMTKITDLVITLERSGKALETAVKYLRELMAYDEVTKMFSRRYIFHLIEKELYRAKRYENLFSVIALEIDPFNNDAHVSLDDLNQIVGEGARIVRKFIRDSDSPGRTADRMFMVLLPETNAKGAYILAERIRKTIDKEYKLSTGKVRVTVSGAIVESTDPSLSDMADLLYAIDQKLNTAREGGANKVIK